MITFFSAEAINVFSLKNLTEWIYPVHQHHYYELILIEEGFGEHIINNVRFSYKPKDIFLLTPSDSHMFLIKAPTTLHYIKFTEQIFAEKLEENPNVKWLKVIEKAIVNYKNQQGDIINCETDRTHIFALYAILASEYDKVCLFSRHALLDIFGAILSMVSRNLSSTKNSLNTSNGEVNELGKITDILLYIRQNIKDPEKLSIKHLTEVFHFSPAYLGIFIKKHTGHNLRSIILSTKLKLAEQLLTQSDFTISEIAYQLGFTDGSHFNKIIKKHMGINPKDMRIKKHVQEKRKEPIPNP